METPKEVNPDKDVPKSYREKYRTSYKFQYFRIDFNIVKSIYNFTKKNIDINALTGNCRDERLSLRILRKSILKNGIITLTD